MIPDLDTPGNKAAITWNKPIINACLNVNDFRSSIVVFLFNDSIIINNKPTVIKAIETDNGL